MLAKYDLESLSDVLDFPKRDELFVYAGLDGLMNRYAIKGCRSGTNWRRRNIFSCASPWALHITKKIRPRGRKSSTTRCRNMNTSPEVRRTSAQARPARRFRIVSFSKSMTTWSISLNPFATSCCFQKVPAASARRSRNLRAVGSPLKSNFGGVFDRSDSVRKNHRHCDPRHPARRQEKGRALLLYGKLASRFPGIHRLEAQCRRRLYAHAHRQHGRIHVRRIHEARPKRPGLVYVRPGRDPRP